MKNIIKLFWIIALVGIIGFSMVACDNGSTGSGGNIFANTTWVASMTPGFENELRFITSSDWAISTGGFQALAGTYTVSGGTATLMMMGAEFGTATISGDTLTLIGFAAMYGSSWTKR